MTGNKNLKTLLEKVRTLCEKGERRELSATLRQIMSQRRDFYRESNENELEDDFSDSLFKILLLELDQEEQDSIETAELAYTSLTSLIGRDQDITPEHYKRRLLLLHYFSDYFTDAVIDIFLKQYRDSDMLEARKLAIECLEKMQLADMFLLEENYPDFINHDEQLGDACNTIETAADLSDKERANAALLHKILHAYLKVKYKDKQ